MYAMIVRMESGPVSRRISPLAALGITLALIFVTARLFEDPNNPATTLRICVAVFAVSFLIFARRYSLVERATVFLALEAFGGFVAFTYVDVPFVLAHQAQIGHLAISFYRGLGHH